MDNNNLVKDLMDAGLLTNDDIFLYNDSIFNDDKEKDFNDLNEESQELNFSSEIEESSNNNDKVLEEKIKEEINISSSLPKIEKYGTVKPRTDI